MSSILSLQEAKNSDMSIKKTRNTVSITMSHEVYNMLVIECKLTMYELTAGRNQASVNEIIKAKKVMATINTAPMAEDLPTVE